MAIGNAAWPIGVTMVGIHARTGREKIFARNVAHVLNDETQRKYIQVHFTLFLFNFFAISALASCRGVSITDSILVDLGIHTHLLLGNNAKHNL